jgi:ribonuclease P protein component
MDGQTRNTLPKKERLCGKTSISMLLAKGRHGNVPNMRYLCLKNNGKEFNRIMVSVPKKLFKRAVKRNLLKRRIRESYRKQKHDLNLKSGVDLLFMYSTKEVLSYEEIYKTVGQIIRKINESE